MDSDIDLLNFGDGKYNLWMSNGTSKPDGGVMLLVGKELIMESTTHGKRAKNTGSKV